jgi:tetratricopeptide (TPR) repeat protein
VFGIWFAADRQSARIASRGSMSKSFLKAAFFGAALAGAAALALAPSASAAERYAKGGGGGGGSGGGSAAGGPGSDSAQCANGFVFDKGKGICVRGTSGLIDDRRLLAEGRLLALGGRYEHALSLLEAVRNKQDTMVQTYIGYSKRKLGRIDEGLAHYKVALELDPNNLNAREYLGEGYVQAGRTDLALAELGTLEKLCGTECEEYELLQMAIAGVPDAWAPATVAQ